ncbi:MAG: MOSC N-terminal beta barrel domain-containing protein [Pseudomonadales bacterium]|nr:MOSC N-terminal beta barrel domain-containing protein [Pseudomonadales bacterium]
MSIGQVKQIFRHPVKSMLGESLEQARLEARGIPGDRAWAVRDEDRGGIRGAKRFPQLMTCAARYLTDPPVEGSATARVTLPDGRELDINHPDMPAALSSLIDSPVTVWPLMPADMLDHYRRGAPVLPDQEAEFRRMFARTPEEPLPELSAFPPELFEFESPLGTYFDAFPLLLMTSNGLRHLAGLMPGQRFDVRRFRPNFLIDVPVDEPFPERAWAGRTLQIGSAEIEVTIECPRCVMTTHGFGDLPRDPGIMRTLVREAGGNLGMYARVSKPGTVTIGDSLTLVD